MVDFETIRDRQKRLTVEDLVEMQLSCQGGACLLQREIAAEGEVEDGSKYMWEKGRKQEDGKLGSERRYRYLLPKRKLR